MTAAADTRMDRPDAIEIAKTFVELLDGTYDELKVAGSLRRRLARIGDIEVIAVPRTHPVTVDLLGDEIVPHDLLNARMADLLEAGTVSKRLDRNGVPRWGPTLKFLAYRGARIDLFCPEAARLGWILALRTGPAAFSRQLVMPVGRRTRDGRPGLLPPTVMPRDGWLTRRTSGERIATPAEADVFALYGLDYLEPWERT